jgi:flagellar hook-associated protein 3 FlgL
MVSRVSATGTLSQNLFLINSGQSKLNQLNYSLGTGNKFEELKFYGKDSTRIVDLRKDIEARKAYTNSIDITESTTDSYDAILERLVQVATDALNAAEPLSTNDVDFPNTTTVLANNFMLEVEANLNIKLGDRFIFAGTNFSDAPVRDLRTLSLYNATDLGSAPAAANAIETADTLPEHVVDAGGAATTESYHTGFTAAGTVDSKAYEAMKVTIADSQPIIYNITANEPAFQNLIEGLLRLKSAAQTGLTEPEREEFLGEARNTLDNARVELRQLQARNGTVINELSRTKEIHTSFINISQSALTDLTVANDAEVATRIAALRTQLEASYSTIADTNRLSLVNYL